jgi:hypothetical protein
VSSAGGSCRSGILLHGVEGSAAAAVCVPPSLIRPSLPLPPQAEFKDAAAQFGQYGQQYDAERLREQVYETIQVGRGLGRLEGVAGWEWALRYD